MKDKEFYFIATGDEQEEDRDNLLRVFDNLMGFVDCLENPMVKEQMLACGVWHVGEVQGTAMIESYEMGRKGVVSVIEVRIPVIHLQAKSLFLCNFAT